MDKKSINKWKEFKDSPKYVLSESGLSRAWDHISNHDTAIITAFRNDPLDNSECAYDSDREEEGNTVLQINKERNHDLKAALLYNRYGVTRADGAYIDNMDSRTSKPSAPGIRPSCSASCWERSICNSHCPSSVTFSSSTAPRSKSCERNLACRPSRLTQVRIRPPLSRKAMISFNSVKPDP